MPMEVKKDYQKIYDYIVSQASKDNLPAPQKQRYLYMLDKINELQSQGVDFNTAVQKAYSGANISYAQEREKQAVAAGDTAHVKFFQSMRGHALTMTQKGQNIAMAKAKRPPGYNPASVPYNQRLGAVAGRNVHVRRYDILIYIIAGILCFFIPPLFGIPALEYLAIALIVFIPIYSLMPGQGQVVGSLGGGRITREAPWQIGSLMTKSISKIAAFILIILQFYVGFTVFRLITVVIAFLFYFSMPMHYRTSEPYRMVEAWFRMLLGVFIAYMLSMTFTGFGPMGNGIGSAFLLLGLAFFVTFPTHIQDQNSVVNISFLNNLSESREFQMIDRLLFSSFMLFSFFIFLSTMSGNIGDFSHIIFYAVGGMAFFTGFSTGPEGRPALGVIMILIMAFILTSSYPGYFGQSVFGYYWPQIQSFGDTYLGPLNTAWAQAQSSMGDAWEMMTCPQCYYLKMQQKEQATKSVIMTGGTPMSIEISKFELVPSMIGTLEPSEPVIGNMELHNQGDFTSKEIKLDLFVRRVNATELKEYPTGEISKLYCSQAVTPYGSSNGGSSGNTLIPANCDWTGKTYPTEMRSITFKLDEGLSAWDGIFNDCSDISTGTLTSCTPCFGGCTLESGNITYDYAGTSVKVYANLTYDYVVNVSMPINIIGSDLYLKKLQAGDIILQDFTSEYTGGPTKATLWTPKQPARTDIPFLVVASIYNDGSGEILKIDNFKITIYNSSGSISDVTLVGSSFRKSSPQSKAIPDGCAIGPPEGKNFIINCEHNYSYTASPQYSIGTIKPGEYKRVSFYITPNNATIDQKTTQITGQADYTYRKTTSQTLTVANAPPQ